MAERIDLTRRAGSLPRVGRPPERRRRQAARVRVPPDGKTRPAASFRVALFVSLLLLHLPALGAVERGVVA